VDSTAHSRFQWALKILNALDAKASKLTSYLRTTLPNTLDVETIELM